MSVVRDTSQIIVFCDGPPDCQNNHVIDNNPTAIREADDWLSRHGWRSTGDGSHYCKFCVDKLPMFQGAGLNALEQRRRAYSKAP